MRPPQVIADSNVIIARLITLFAASVDIKLLTPEQRAIAHAATRMVEEHLAQTGFYYRYGKLAHAVHIWSHAQAHTHMRVCTTASVKPCVGIHGIYHVHAGLHMPEFYDVLSVCSPHRSLWSLVPLSTRLHMCTFWRRPHKGA